MPRGIEDILTTPDSTFSYDDSSGVFDWDAFYVSPGRSFNPLRVVQTQNYDPGRFTPPPEIFPTVRVIEPETASVDDPEDFGTAALPPSVVDPEQNTTTTVYEDAPGGIYETTRAETDWDAVYDEYVILNAPPEEDVPLHNEIIDWGVDILSTVAGGILDPAGIGQAIQTAYAPSWLTGPTGTTVTGIPGLGQQTTLQPAPGGTVAEHGCPPYGPKYAKICLATNVITPLRRRRRRRLLTSSDIKDLSALKSIVGGAALQAAVTQAVRR